MQAESSLSKSRTKMARASLASCVLMYGFVALAAPSFFYKTYRLFLNMSSNGEVTPLFFALVEDALTIATFVLFAEFFRNLTKEASPFGGRQSLRLIVAAVIGLGCRILESLVSVGSFYSISADMPIPIIKTADSPMFFSDLAVFSFLICFALVIKYSDALKEDSDSFL